MDPGVLLSILLEIFGWDPPSLPPISGLCCPPVDSQQQCTRKRVHDNTAPANMAVAEDILKDPYFADLDIDLSQFSEEEKTVILGVMQKAKVGVIEKPRSCYLF